MPEVRPERLTRPGAQLLVIDIQEKLLPHIAGQARVLAQAARMIRAAVSLDLPVTISEQYVRGLGATRPEILAAVSPQAAVPIEKVTFSACRHGPLWERLVTQQRPQILLAGIETHVCVLQTALDLLERQCQPVVLADAVGSRRRLDHRMALERLRAAGAVVSTVESAIFELLEQAGTELFKRLLPIVR